MPSTKSGVAAHARSSPLPPAVARTACGRANRARGAWRCASAVRGPVASDCASVATAASSASRGHDAIDEAEAQRLGGVEALDKQQDLHRLAQADDARQRPRAAAVGRERDVPIGRGEVGVLGGDRQVARAHQRQAEAGDRAVHLRDDGCGIRCNVSIAACSAPRMRSYSARRARRRRRRGRRRSVLQVAAGHEMLAGAAHDHDAHARRRPRARPSRRRARPSSRNRAC